MRILFLNNQFERGGAARVASILCNELHRRGYKIVLVTDWSNWRETYSIDSGITIREIVTKGDTQNVCAKLKKWLNCSNRIRRYIKETKPDLIIGTESMMFLCAWLANLGIGVPIIAADHTSFSRKIDPIIDFVRYHLYARADALSILTKKDERLLGQKFPNKNVIYNPLSFPILEKAVKRRKNILCAGRLEVWDIKGFDIIIEIWSHICTKYLDWTLEIAGSGTKDSIDYINGLISEYGIQNRVTLLGQINDMQELYAQSSIFALSSRMEGFPMVLMEAMSQGCACVAFEVGGSTYEMLDSESGIIIKDGDIEAFEKALARMIEGEDLRRNFSNNSIKSVSIFSVDKFVDDWETLIKKTLKNK